MAIPEITPGLMDLGFRTPAMEASAVGLEGSGDLFEQVIQAEITDEDVKVWDKIRNRLGGYEKEFLSNEDILAEGVLLAKHLLENKELTDDDIERAIESSKDVILGQKRTLTTDEESQENILKVIAMTRVGLSFLIEGKRPQISQAGGGGEGNFSLRSFRQAQRDKRLVRREMREAANVGPEVAKDTDWYAAQKRACALFASLFFSDRYDQEFVFNLKQSDPEFKTLVGDWLRELFEANRDIQTAHGAMAGMMSADGKRSEEIMRSGIKDTDFLRMLAARFPLVVQYAENSGDAKDLWKTKTFEASVWDVVNYLYGMDRVEVDSNKKVVGHRNTTDPTKIRIEVVGANDAVAADADCEIVDLGNPRKFQVLEDFKDGATVKHAKDTELLIESLSNEDLALVNQGKLKIIPKLRGTGVFEAKPKVKGSSLLVDRAEAVAHGASWGYFTDLLARNGIKVEQVRDFLNPLQEMGINAGVAGDLGAGWLSELKGWDTFANRGKALVVRNLAATLAPIFSMGQTMAEMMGHQMLWNPTYDGSRVMRLIELTLLAHQYDEVKGISVFDGRFQLLHPLYPVYQGRLAKNSHPVVMAWAGKEIDFSDRVYPWEDKPEHGAVDVRLKPIDFGDTRKKLKSAQIKYADLKRKNDYGISVSGLQDSDKQVKELEAEVDKAQRIDNFIFMEQTFEPGDWVELKAVNAIYHTARASAARGGDAQEILKKARSQMEEYIKLSLRNPVSKRTDVLTVRNSSGIIAAATGLTAEERDTIKERSMFDLIEGLTTDAEEKQRLAILGKTHPELFKGILGPMVFASEVFGLEQFDYGATEREIEAWMRYLMSNAEVYSTAKQIFKSVIHVATDPALVKQAVASLYTPDSMGEGFSQRLASSGVDWIEAISNLPKLLNEAEASALFKDITGPAAEWANKHADMNWKQRRQIFKALVYIVDGWVDTGMEYLLHSREAETADNSSGVKSLPGDRHVPLILDPEDPSLLTDVEKEVEKGLIEIFMAGGWRVDFNDLRKSKGVILLNGGAVAQRMEGGFEEGRWRAKNLHDAMSEPIRLVDQYGMGVLFRKIIGNVLIKTGQDLGLLVAEDLKEYQDDANLFDKLKPGNDNGNGNGDQQLRSKTIRGRR